MRVMAPLRLPVVVLAMLAIGVVGVPCRPRRRRGGTCSSSSTASGPTTSRADVMPQLTALGRRGVVFTRHHAVYPSVTRVNASSIATGAYPDTHGLMGNSVYFPRVDPAAVPRHGGPPRPVADRRGGGTAAHGADARRGAAGRRPPDARRQLGVRRIGGAEQPDDRRAAPSSIRTSRCRSGLRDDMKVLGDPPPGDGPTPARDRYAVDAFLKVGLPRVDPTVTVLWLGALDSTAHAKGIGDPATIDVLRHVDGEIGRVEDGLAAAGLRDDYEHLGDIRPRLLHAHGRHRRRGAAEAVRPHAARRHAAHRRGRRGDLRARSRRGDGGGHRAARCSRRRALARSSRGPRSRDPSTGACRARCRSTWRTGTTIDPRRSCSRRTGRTRRTRTACAARWRPAEPRGTAARARGTSTTRSSPPAPISRAA